MFSNGFSTMQLQVTQNAVKRINELIKIEKNPHAVLRISVDAGGCNGYIYKYELTSKITEDDYMIEKDGIKIIIDSISQPFMAGSIVDFIEELGNEYFEIRNPNASAGCGCGNSFSV